MGWQSGFDTLGTNGLKVPAALTTESYHPMPVNRKREKYIIMLLVYDVNSSLVALKCTSGRGKKKFI